MLHEFIEKKISFLKITTLIIYLILQRSWYFES